MDRTLKSLTRFSGRLKTLMHAYKRDGTTTLFAAIKLAESWIITECMARQQHRAWIRFLKPIDAETNQRGWICT